MNKKAPTAIVLQGLAISLRKISEGEGMVEIWAIDFDPGKKIKPSMWLYYLTSFQSYMRNK
ncbi:MAG: hypothetical protein IPJ39_21150 [Saprospiraceae bacterium]|nr:hypothetical protein [Saprospiraceae bacterium]